MSSNDIINTRSRAQQQQQQQQQLQQEQPQQQQHQDWELERQQLCERINALELQLQEANARGDQPPSDGSPSNRPPLSGSTQFPGERKDAKAIISTLPNFVGNTGEQPSSRSSTSLLSASSEGCSEQEVLSSIPSKLRSSAFTWHELQVRKTNSSPWSSTREFCENPTSYFTSEESLDQLLSKWDTLAQQSNESVIQFVQRFESLKLQLELAGHELSDTSQYHKFRRSLRTHLKQALLNHFGASKFEAKGSQPVKTLFQEAVAYLSVFESISKPDASHPRLQRNSTASSNVKDRKGISPEVFSQRARQGLCGYCGEQRWRPGHKCKAFSLDASKQRNMSTKKRIQMVLSDEQDAQAESTLGAKMAM